MKKVTQILVSLVSKLGIKFISVDKQIHFIIGFLTSAIVLYFTKSIAAGLIVTFFLGFYKEFKDEMDYAGFDWKDLLATMIGGVIPALIKIFIL